MKATNLLMYSIAIALVNLAVIPPGQALDTGNLAQPSLERIQQQVEDRAQRQVEQHIERRSERALQAIQDRLPQSPTDLPDRLPILSADGSEAFADVRVEHGWRAVERQWLAMLAPGELQQLKQPGIHIIDTTPLEQLDLRVVRFRVDKALDSREALSRILPPSLVERLDRNHIYSPQGEESATGGNNMPSTSHSCDTPVTVGMVDTAIQADHPSLAEAHIIQKRFLGNTPLADRFRAPRGHGTAVASLLVGRLPERDGIPLAGATLLNASVFFSREQLASGATLLHLVKGLNWLVSQQVDVINISMAGPDNRLLATVVDRLNAAGVPLVAAVGNRGPAAPPLYPAAYPGVIGVTAVDRAHRIYRWANQGDQVDFAAAGVDVSVAESGGGFTALSGTSMATPVVTARLACQLAGSSASLPEILDHLAAQALDLGKTGRDPVFGYGAL
ncbi:S8 family serine peptidase [Marinobacter halodurans]|nr:S8 family serine peptidase [Marinobacter halodurans]